MCIYFNKLIHLNPVITFCYGLFWWSGLFWCMKECLYLMLFDVCCYPSQGRACFGWVRKKCKHIVEELQLKTFLILAFHEACTTMGWALAIGNPQRSRNAGITIHQSMKLQHVRKKTMNFLIGYCWNRIQWSSRINTKICSTEIYSLS